MQGSNGIQERLRELAAKIAAETEHDKFTALVEELNGLLDQELHPRQPASPASNS